jgi:hypothetical protein
MRAVASGISSALLAVDIEVYELRGGVAIVVQLLLYGGDLPAARDLAMRLQPEAQAIMTGSPNSSFYMRRRKFYNAASIGPDRAPTQGAGAEREAVTGSGAIALMV